MTVEDNAPVDLLDPAFMADPGPAYERLRSTAPVTRIRLRPGLSPWLISGYEEARTVLSDPVFSVDPARTRPGVREAIAAGRAEEKTALLGRHLLSVDPPDHTRMRRLMSRALTARRMQQLRGPVGTFATELLDALTGRREFDVLGDYALPLAVRVICELIGIPPEDRAAFQRWGSLLVRSELQDDASFDRVSDEMAGYLVPLVAARRAEPADDLVSALVAAHDEERLDDYELISLVYQLFFAGHESSAYLIANATLRLLAHPDERAALAREPERIESLIEEVLRIDGPVKVPTWRFPVRDVDLAGVRLRAGEPVLVLLGAAGRDPRRFPDPDRFDTGRTAVQQHLAFSHGIHHCMGAAVGRMEGQVAVGRLFQRFPELRLAVPPERLRWRDNLMMRGVCELPVRVG
ncbi:cytochrome P450 family protein [Streptomyces cyanogenus]|uniref:Cytochrome P450 107B1 n=1 Tax=Streptomyces cyanogenus TaxID=80860 RepID=A0ABX7TTT0_STRCY|nr:cytochrome P450 [Streptomyces cyanogenus]QTE00116.1 Cytochrome P450 107B1 [Streptomyces cyanogenus]